MANAPICPTCRAPRRDDAPGGVCPACLLEAALFDGAGPAIRGVSSTASPAHATSVTGPSRSATPPGVLETLAGSFGSVPHVLLRDTDGGTEPPLHRPAGANDPGTASRYRIDGEIARGGMGAVLKGRDPDLGRDVALKVLREDLQDNADMVRRFVEEAQIGGQLQHPGIVPIYELGTFTDNRPFFSMKLVKGHTLAGMLEDRAKQSDDLPKFLAIFESIAQTVAYAHARGVIHRDLKPSNVMVGSFGEVQVMDWGLAKVLPRGGLVDDAQAGKPDRQETVIATARSGSDDSDLSRAGSVMGTPSYMAPEQARGEVDRIDERADVFALGSILCEILTGEPAFLGRGGGEIQRKAALGDLTDATTRLDGCGADAELVALAMHCLAREMEDRPREAGAVSGRVTAYLAGVQNKLRRAEVERVEERARRRLTTVAAAALIVLGLAGGGGYVWNAQRKADRVAKTARGVDEALADAARLRGEAQAAPASDAARWAEALSAARRAEGLLAQGEADAPLTSRVTALLAQLDRERAGAADKAQRLEADRVLLSELESIRGNRADHEDMKRTDAAYGAAFRKAGLDLDATEPVEAGKWLTARSQPVELAGYLDDWAFVRRNSKPAVADWRRLVAAARAADLDPWRDALRAKMGITDKEAIAEFQRLADDENALDTQPALSLFMLSRQLKYGAGDRERAARVLRRTVSRHAAEFWAHHELGQVHGADSGSLSEVYPRPEESVRHLTAAVAIRPGSVMARVNLGVALIARGKHDEAVAELREAIRLGPGAAAHAALGHALYDQGKLDLAVVELREAIRLEPDDASAHANLGIALDSLGKTDQAIASYREAIRKKPDFASVHANLGRALRKQGKVDEAIAEYHKEIRLKPDDATPYAKLGAALKDQGKLDLAAAAYREAIRKKPDFASAHANLGAVLNLQEKYGEAIAACREAIRVKPDHAGAHQNLGLALQGQGKFDESLTHFHEAIRLKPDDSAAHSNLGILLWDMGRLEEAMTEYREAIRKKPDSAAAHNNLASALSMHPDPARREPAVALEYARKATALQPGEAAFINTLATAQYRAGLRDEAIASFRRSMELRNGGDPYDWFFLAMIEHERGKAEEAGRWFDKSANWMKGQKSKDADLLQIWAEAAKLLMRPGPEAADQKPAPHRNEKP